MPSDADIKEDYCRQMFKHLDENLNAELKRRFTSSDIWEFLRHISDWQVVNYKTHLAELARVVNWPDNYTNKNGEELVEFMDELKRI